MIENYHKHSKKVFITKIFLSFIIVLIIATLVVFPILNNANDDFRITFKSDKNNAFKDPATIMPHFIGVDVNNKTYDISARKALKMDKDKIAFEDISAKLFIEEDVLYINSKYGDFNKAKDILILKDGVKGNLNNQYRFMTDKVTIDTQNGIARSDSIVKGKGPLGRIIAQSMLISDNGKYLLFNGKVKIKLNLDEF